MGLFELLLIAGGLIAALVAVDGFWGAGIISGWVLRSLATMLRRRSPAMARQAGLGGEHVEALNAGGRAAGLVGKTGTVEAAIQVGGGRVVVDGVSWPALGPETAAGAAVRVTRADGNRLIVAPVESGTAEHGRKR